MSSIQARYRRRGSTRPPTRRETTADLVGAMKIELRSTLGGAVRAPLEELDLGVGELNLQSAHGRRELEIRPGMEAAMMANLRARQVGSPSGGVRRRGNNVEDSMPIENNRNRRVVALSGTRGRRGRRGDLPPILKLVPG